MNYADKYVHQKLLTLQKKLVNKLETQLDIALKMID